MPNEEDDTRENQNVVRVDFFHLDTMKSAVAYCYKDVQCEYL